MNTVSRQIQSADIAICQNINTLSDNRTLLAQNLLPQLRNLVEGVTVLLYTGSENSAFSYDAIQLSLEFVRSKAKFNFLGKFHKLLQKSTSHYSFEGDTSERLMLKYYEYLHRLRSLLRDHAGMSVLANLESFPVDLDPSLREYHEKIAARIDLQHSSRPKKRLTDRYYIQKTRAFYVNGNIYYEVTFCRAINKASKFDRIIAFTSIDMTDKYAAMLTLHRDSIDVLDQTMPITIISRWEVSIRPCEFNNFARLFGATINVRTTSSEYIYLMRALTEGSGSLLGLMHTRQDRYQSIRAAATAGNANPQIFPVLDEARRIVQSNASGCNVLRYLLLRMNNQILKPQFDDSGCQYLSNLKLRYQCIPFDTMPFCTSLPGHNPRFWDLFESLDAENRKHEMLVRRLKNNVERLGVLYTPLTELQEYGSFQDLMSTYNGLLYYRHEGRRLLLDKNHVFIKEYEDDTFTIVNGLQNLAASGIAGFQQSVEHWLNKTPHNIDDPAKTDALKLLFSQSHVALIYGAAGTGKSTMVNIIANFFNDKRKLFLAHTNPATDNLKRRVTAQNSSFRTISSQIHRSSADLEYDILVIDECSTVSNSDLIAVLEKTAFKLLVLVGDVYQIESIQFGNWFSVIRSFLPGTAVFELTTPFRTHNPDLLTLWSKVRNIEEDIAEALAHNGHSTLLDQTLFERQGQDEIILCLNYDGLYGINNVNRFLQSSNTNQAFEWRESIYKINDPVLFHEAERFRPIIYNNLKGIIVDIVMEKGWIQFDIELEIPVNEFDVAGVDLEWVRPSVVRFKVYDYVDSTDEDNDQLDTSVPFQVAYAVSIHKAQGLEYDTVKIVITDANENDISHSIFYTAITRARNQLRIFWTPETQQSVLQQLCHHISKKDVALIASRRGLIQV